MKKTKIVIAGGGFAGLYAAKYLNKRLARRPDRSAAIYTTTSSEEEGFAKAVEDFVLNQSS